MTILSIDIGGTHLRIGAVGEDGSLLKFEKVPTSSILRTGDVMAELGRHLAAFSAGLGCKAAAIGFPATLNAERTRVLQAPNIPYMEDLPVCRALEQTLGIPVAAERDVTFALCYDAEKYRLPQEGLICGVYFGTGIGNALLLNGRPLTGRHGTAGELGHIPVPGCTLLCGCGNRGCLEALAGGKALERLRRELFPDTPIGELFVRHGLDGRLLEIVDGMAAAVSTEINILDPDAVLLGGGVLSMPAFPLALLEARIRLHTRRPLPLAELQLLFTGDEAEKSVLGGAIYARRRFGKNAAP